MANGGRVVSAPPPVLAASLMLLRDGDEGLEVFMLGRHHHSSAFSGAQVFPGGKLDPEDKEPGLAALCDGGDGDGLLGFRIAAVRETFEECGVLFARAGPETALLDHSHALQAERARLLAAQSTLLSLCRRWGLRLATDLLVPFARWITPPGGPRVFDTWFFLAPAPPAQHAEHDGREHFASGWVAPGAALAGAEAGEIRLVFPTRMSLLKLVRSATVAAALENAANDPGARVAVQPRVEAHADGRLMLIPAEAGYGASKLHFSADGRRLTVLA